ncbi:uncharacterized protein NPIL_629001 [Nephila pilipes]|uniref:Uncharacterized protein n=1 Tax=Nephila pilipes TaxID=299642 RepID=A0A8X6UJA9_NEPPI|nr:uncharacterized protein NPIL_629001 [Nephila pilipes]
MAKVLFCLFNGHGLLNGIRFNKFSGKHRNMLKTLLILILAGTGLHSAAAEKPQDEADSVKYKGPVVYSNLPPPVLYFPNFPPKPKISSRGDSDEKRVEYVPFPYKDLPLLVYQSENQPPVHVVEKPQKQNVAQPQQARPSGGSTDMKMQQQSGPAVYQMSGNQQQYPSSQPQTQSNTNGHLTSGITVTNQFPDLQNQQYISIGLSAIHQQLPSNAAYNTPQTVAQPKPSSPMQKQNTMSYQVQNNVRQNVQQQTPYSTVPQNINQNNAQAPVQYVITNMGQQQAQNYAYQHVNQQQYSGNQPAPQQAQQNNGMQYISNTKVQLQAPQLQYNIQQQQQSQYNQAPSPQQQNQYMQAPSPQQQTQYMQIHSQQPVQNSQAQNSVAYNNQPSNEPQTVPMNMQQIIYQTTANAAAAMQQLGVSLPSVPQTQPKVNNQYTIPQQMINKNPPQKMVQNKPQPMQQPQVQTSGENEQDEQYLSIALYPYGIQSSNYAQQPQQFYKIVLPPINEQYQQDNSNEPKQMNANPPAEPQKQTMQQMVNQGYRYTNAVSSPQNGPSQNQQGNVYGDPKKQMNAVDNRAPQKQMPQQQETPEESDSEEDEIEYQQILIHIPHMLAAQPQILVQQDEKARATPYTGTAQVAGQVNRTNQLMKAAMNNLRKNPFYNLANKNRYATNMQSPMSLGGSMNSNFRRPSAFQKLPAEYQSGSESSMYPYRLRGSSFRPKPIVPYKSRHPGVFSSSNMHFTSVSPYFTKPKSFRNNRNRSPYSSSFDQMSASVNRPSFLNSPSRPYQSLFSSFPDEMLAEASFQSPTFFNSKNKINLTSIPGAEDLFSEFDDLSDLTSFDLSALSDSGKTFSDENSDKFLQKLTRDFINQGMSAGMYPGSKVVRPGQNAMSVLNTPQLISPPVPIRINAAPVPIVPLVPQYPQQFIHGNRFIPPYPGVQAGKGKNVKYGTFIKKLTTLSNILLKQSIGKKSQITPREESKTEEPTAEEYNIEEIDDSEVPKEESPKSTNANKDGQGLDGISIPLNPNWELSRRVSKPQEDIPRPPIIVYKGAKPPVEVYGTKEDIEGQKDTLGPSSSKHETDIDRKDGQKANYLKMMYSIIPDFIKHSISSRNDDTSASLGDGWQPINLPQIKPTDDIEDRIALEDKVKVKADIPEGKDYLKSSKSSKESEFSFKEDIEELAKLLHKDEKSDIFSS